MSVRAVWLCGALALMGLATAATSSETPDAFMKRVSAAYSPTAKPEEGENFCAQFCEPELAAIVAHANDNDYVMEYDPFCSCQDVVDALPVESVKTTGAGMAEATLHRDDTIWVLVLKQHDGAWKIADVIEKAPYDNGSWKKRISALMKAK